MKSGFVYYIILFYSFGRTFWNKVEHKQEGTSEGVKSGKRTVLQY